MNISSSPRRSTIISDESSQRRHKPDYVLLLICAALLSIGLVLVYAISPALGAQVGVGDNYYIGRHLVSVILAIAAFFVVSSMKPQLWKKIERPMVWLALGASVAVRLFGEEVNGAYRWIQIGGFSFQAAELIKFALILWLTGFLVTRVREGTIASWQKTLKPLCVVMAMIGVIVAGLQSDLGSAAVMVAIIAAMVFVAGMPIKKVAIVGLIIILGVGFFIATSEYRRSRVQTFLNPTADCQGAGYQACQALIAVGSGGVFGLGVGHSVQAYGYLPEAANDSIFAIYAEKFGFVGSVVLIGLFGGLFARLKRIIEHLPDNYNRFLIVGVLAWLSAQSIINIGAMIGVLPIKGITLPFISYGGTSIVFIAAAVGLAFSVSRYTSYRPIGVENNKGSQHEDHARGRGLRRPHNPVVSRRP